VPIRAVFGIFATIVGVVLLASFKTPDVPASPSGGSVAVATAPPNPPDNGTGGGSSSSTSSSGSGYRDGRYTGQDAPNEYGDVQVLVVVSGGRITDVQSLQLPSDRRRSAYISQVAGPLLHDEVLQAQGAQIDVVSGATYTSDSYAQSVQSALDQAHG
jgi:uncharacterized protein with FMN-binding domain